ncbi:stage III sporulation protein AA [Alicyclobacillus sp. SO9]|uniref:stage III sporulation protein AA n=1 Tax=Alicyclobacillus sp. SO9 TaxID=2665646 RepID=UPI001E2956F8|nr:stage III sporulation protein AA [Alicyclobacillus sp. SO9]
MSNQLWRRAQEQAWKQVLSVCPPDVQQSMEALPANIQARIEEIRFRLGKPLQVCGEGVDRFLTLSGSLTASETTALFVSEEHLSRVLQVVTQSSLYAVEDELRRGFITMPGGHRVGVAGRAVLYESGEVRSIRSISSVNVRIARERIGAADGIMAMVRRHDGRPYNTLVISPPQCGKTTLIRDMARQWSAGIGDMVNGLKVSIIDERSEIAGCVDGKIQFQLGARTDVLDACPKAEGMLMAIRSLSPDVVVTDEIGRKQDRDAILEATHAGVGVLTSAHARDVAEWSARPFMAELFAANAFQRYIVLSRRRGPGTVERVLDADGKPVKTGTARRITGGGSMSP